MKDSYVQLRSDRFTVGHRRKEGEKTFRVVQGECLTAPSNETLQVWNVTSTPPLLERTERQCLIVCDTDCMTIKAEGLWMDSIYWRFKRTERSDSSSNESVDTQVRCLEPCRLFSTQEIGHHTEEERCFLLASHSNQPCTFSVCVRLYSGPQAVHMRTRCHGVRDKKNSVPVTGIFC